MHLILQFWNYAIGRQQKPRPVYAIAGHTGILGWSVDKKQARKELDNYGEVHGPLTLVKMEIAT